MTYKRMRPAAPASANEPLVMIVPGGVIENNTTAPQPCLQGVRPQLRLFDRDKTLCPLLWSREVRNGR